MDTFFSQLSSLSLLSITVRLLLTTVFAGTLGYERERHRQAAGFRTYIIVADAAALVMMTNLYIGDVFGSTDLVRMPASVITGLGFLGAGTILVTKSHEIKGLTTAAGLWAVSIIGTAIGAGFYTGGTVCYAFILLAMNVLRLVDVRIQSRQKTATVYFELRSKLSIGQLVRLARIWDDPEKHRRFDLLVLAMMGVIALITGGMALVMGTVGIPVMSFMYGIDFGQFRSLCLVMVATGGVCACIDFLYQIITVLRAQEQVSRLYLIAIAFAVPFSMLLVSFAGLAGAVVSSLVSMAILLVLLVTEYFAIRRRMAGGR